MKCSRSFLLAAPDGAYVYKPNSSECFGNRSTRWNFCYVGELDVISSDDSSTTLRRTYEVGLKSNENDFFNLLNIHAITVYPLQSRLLAIECNDSSVSVTLQSSGGSFHLRCCSKPSSQLPERFQLSQNYVL